MGVLALLGLAAAPFGLLLEGLSQVMPEETATKIVAVLLYIPFRVLGIV